MDLINNLIDGYNIPILSAFLLGIMTSISPCPLATNITAIAYIAKDVKSARQTIVSGLLYTLGRAISYTLLATLIYFGLSSLEVSRLFQGWGDKVLGPLLIIIGLFMLGAVKINYFSSNKYLDRVKVWLSERGYLGSLVLGMLFAFAFCPYSGVLFFGILIPLVLESSASLLLPPLFALGTSLPVIAFAFLIAFSMQAVSRLFSTLKTIEKYIRYFVAAVFILVGLYYFQFLVKFMF